jgi:hypothetical protein
MYPARKFAVRLFAILSFLWLAACDVIPTVGLVGANNGPSIDVNAPVQVALLVPGGTGTGSDQLLANNLENAARLAVSDLNGVQVDLRVYNTGSDTEQAARVATLAVDDGAQILLGPLFAEAANAAGVAVASRNVNVLAFSNNPTIAGGNVFILGNTFSNTANRLVNYANRKGLSRIAIVHGEDLGGQLGRDAISDAIRRNGAQLAGVASYPLSQQGIISSTSTIVNTVRQGGADAVFMTAGVNADLPILATTLPEAGLNPASTTYIGLTRWNAAPQALALPGLQNGLFAIPDAAPIANFESRYAATYGSTPHPLAGLAYDGIAAIGALVASGNSGALTKQALTSSQGFQGTAGIFRLLPNGLNEKGLAVATIRNGSVVVLENAPRSFGGGS